MNNTLSGKTILITGGTSRLGRAIVKKSLAADARVLFTYFQNHTEAEMLIALGATGFQLDLCSMSAVDRFSNGFKNQIGKLDVLIHNAAAICDGTIAQLSEADWDRVLTVNLKAPYVLTQQLLPLLLRRLPQERSKIFMIISRMGLNGAYGASNYAASKGGLIGLVKSLAMELGKKKVLVNAVNPGFMQSGMTEKLSEELVQANLQRSPLRDFSKPEEVADFLIYLSSDQMTQITGQVLHVESRPV